MNESIEQLIIYLRGMWEHRWTAMLIAWLAAIGGWLWVTTLPDRFEANTRVYIDTDSVLRPLLKGLTVETDVEQRLQLMTRTLLSRPNLEKLIRMTDMDIIADTPEKQEGLILRLKNNIAVKNVAAASGRRHDNSNFYTISYQNPDRELAKRVVQSLLSILVESSLGDTRKDSTAAREFLDQQIREYEVKLTTSEDRLAEFKRKNMGYLPDREGDYFSSLKDMQQKYDVAKLELREAQKRRDTLKQQLDEFRKNGVATTNQGVPILTPTQERIQALQTRLDDVLLRYTENHPDVQELRSQIAALEKKEKEASAEGGDGNQGNLEANPMYQQLSLALGQEESNIGAAEVRVKEYAERITSLKERIETLQQVEVELNRLDRDYALNKKNYTALVDRRDSAKLAGQAEQTGEGIKFRVIDPPWVPQKATEPNRMMLDSIVFLAAIAAGLGFAFLLSQNNPTFYSRGMLQEITGVAMFGGVTRVYSHKDLVRRRLNHAAYVTAGTLLITVFIAVILVQVFEFEVIANLRQTVRLWL